MIPRPIVSRAVLVFLTVWFIAAFSLGASGVLTALRPPFPQLLLLALTATLLVAYGCVKGFRSWISAIPLSWLVSVHLARFVGIYFLWLYERGQLPFAFAVPGGWGDIAVATTALLLLIVRPTSATVYRVWNIAGLADILIVVFTAARLALQDAASMAALLRLPLSLLPTFLVPLIIFTHIVISFRLRYERFRSVA
jgi:hypothetical protein